MYGYASISLDFHIQFVHGARRRRTVNRASSMGKKYNERGDVYGLPPPASIMAHVARGETENWEVRVPVEYKDTQSSRKKGGWMQAEAYRKDPPPLFHRNDVRRPPFCSRPCRHIVAPPLESLSLPLSPSQPLSLSHPEQATLPALFSRIRSSPSISRPLLFLLSICTLSERFEAR